MKKTEVTIGAYKFTVIGENVPTVDEFMQEMKKSIDNPDYSIVLNCEVKVEKLNK